MLARIRRSAADASSLSSPFGSTHRRIAVCTSRKSPREAVRSASNGNFVASSRNCCRSHPAVSSSDAASRNSAGSSTAPAPSMPSSQPCGSASAPNPSSRPVRSHSRASPINANADSSAARSILGSSALTARRPGAHVVRSRSNSRSLSNSRTSCAVRDIARITSNEFAGSSRHPPDRPPRAPGVHLLRPTAQDAPAPLSGRDPAPAAKNLRAPRPASRLSPTC